MLSDPPFIGVLLNHSTLNTIRHLISKLQTNQPKFVSYNIILKYTKKYFALE